MSRLRSAGTKSYVAIGGLQAEKVFATGIPEEIPTPLALLHSTHVNNEATYFLAYEANMIAARCLVMDSS